MIKLGYSHRGPNQPDLPIKKKKSAIGQIATHIRSKQISSRIRFCLEKSEKNHQSQSNGQYLGLSRAWQNIESTYQIRKALEIVRQFKKPIKN